MKMTKKIIAIATVLVMMFNLYPNNSIAVGAASIKAVDIIVGSSGTGIIDDKGNLYFWSYDSSDEEYEFWKCMGNVKSVSAYQQHYLILTKSGELYEEFGPWKGWEPTKVMDDVAYCDCSEGLEAIIKNNGDLYYRWRYSDLEPNEEFTKVLSGVKSVKLSYSVIAMLTNTNELYTMGNNYHGQIGNGKCTKDEDGNSYYDQKTPYKVLSNVKDYDLDAVGIAAVTNSGDLYAWGGLYFVEEEKYSPTKKVTGVKNVIVGGRTAFYYIKNDGNLYQYGWSDEERYHLDESKKILDNVRTVEKGCGDDTFGAITTNSDLYCWGDNACGEVGVGRSLNDDNVDIEVPEKVLSNASLVRFGESDFSPGTGAITNDGKVYRWGDNDNYDITDNPQKMVRSFWQDDWFVVNAPLCIDINKLASGEYGNDENSKYYTSTTSVLNKNYTQIKNSFVSKFSKFANTSIDDNDIVIPGLIQTNQNGSACNTMVPQGVCVTNKYILISAYDYKKHSDHKSVIYVLRKSDGSYIRTLKLNNSSHVGALAYNGKDGIVYIAGSDEKKVYKLNVSAIDNAYGDVAEVNITPLPNCPVNKSVSFLTYYGGKLYIGQMTDTKKGTNVILYQCDKNGNPLRDKISLPYKTQGIAFSQGINNYDYLIASESLGRKNNSTMEVSRMNMAKLRGSSDRLIPMPCMSEDVDIDGGTIYTCFESAANRYNKGLDGGGNSILPIDRILMNNFQSITGTLVKNNKKMKSAKMMSLINSSEGIDDDDVIECGQCGEGLTYSMYSGGTLMIEGVGEMEDYDSSGETPWSDYSDEICNVIIGADVSSIGENAFRNCSNLEKLCFSRMLDEQEKFEINDYAFYNCKNLKTASMPNVEYDISNTAFEGCTNLQVLSDSDSVNDYCSRNSISLHNHSFKFIETVQSNCLEDGYDLYECECGEEEVKNVKLASNNHNYKLTKTDGNTKIYTCEHCGAQYDEVVSSSTNKTSSNDAKKVTCKASKIKKLKAKKRALKILWKKVSGISGYKIQYAIKKNFKGAKTKIIKKAKTTSVTLKKLKRKKKYYVRIRTYKIVSGKTYQSGWSKAKSKKTK